MDKEETFVSNIDEEKENESPKVYEEGGKIVVSECYLGDSGSMTHLICNKDIELDNEVKTDGKIHGFDGSAVNIKAKGDLIVKDISTRCEVKQVNVGKSKFIKKNIIIIGQLKNEGWILRGNESMLILEKGDKLLRFVKSKEEHLFYMDATVVSKGKTAVNNVGLDELEREDEDNDDYSLPPPLLYPDDDSSSDESSDDENAFDYKSDGEVFDFGYDDVDDGGEWTTVGDIKNFPGYKDKAVIMQAYTAPPGNIGTYSDGAVIVSDSESDKENEEDIAADDREVEVEEPKTTVEKSLSFARGDKNSSKTKHPKRIFKNGNQVNDDAVTTDAGSAIAVNDGNPIPVRKKDIDINITHNQWGHHGHRRLQEMAAVHGFHLSGTLKPCDACSIAKASQTKISKTTETKATKLGERIYMNTKG